MRTEKEMFKLIIDFANENEDIRAVYINGSRANPNAIKDVLQDFDVVYVVKETKKYITDKSWLSAFGDIAIYQEPDNQELFPNDNNSDEKYAFLVQFTDCNRIDFTIQSIEYTKKVYLDDKLIKVLLDKDDILINIPDVTEIDYYTQKPTENKFKACANEFWWVAPYIAKGLKRNQIVYTIECFNTYVKPMLYKMIDWKIGIDNNFSVNSGKFGKFYKSFLSSEDWKSLVKTYPIAEDNDLWKVLFNTCDLFSELSKYVSKKLSFNYNIEEEKGSLEVINEIKKLDNI